MHGSTAKSPRRRMLGRMASRKLPGTWRSGSRGAVAGHFTAMRRDARFQSRDSRTRERSPRSSGWTTSSTAPAARNPPASGRPRRASTRAPLVPPRRAPGRGCRSCTDRGPIPGGASPGGVLDEPVAGGDRGGDRQRRRPLLHGPRRPLTRPSAAATAVRARIAPVPPPPRPLRRFMNRSGGRSTANRSRNWSGPGSAPAPR